MKVAVLGAGGTIAPAIVRDLGVSEEVEQMLLLDLDVGRAEQVASAHGAGKARAARVDARAAVDQPESLARMLEECDVLVNSASYRVNLEAMAACLEAGCHYLDLGGLYWMTSSPARARARVREPAGLLALLGIGSAPGKTNLMAETAVRQPRARRALEERGAGTGIDSVHVIAAGRDLDPPPGFSVPYALQTLLDELTMRPDRPARRPPAGDRAARGWRRRSTSASRSASGRTIYTLHSELQHVRRQLRLSRGELSALPLARPARAELRALVGAPEAEVRRRAAEAAPPSGRTVSVHMVEAAAGERRSRVRAVTEPLEAWGLGGGIVSTAAPIAAAVRLLARGAVDARGALPAGALHRARRTMFAELERRGCRFEVTTPEEVRA